MGITNKGLSQMASRAIQNTANPVRYLAYGTDGTAFDKTQTALGAEVARAEATVSLDTTNVVNDTAKLVKAFNITSAVTVREVGSFDASSGGNMWTRDVLATPRSLNSGDTWTLTIKIVFQCEGSI